MPFLIALFLLLSGCSSGRNSPPPNSSICQPTDPQCEIYRPRIPSPMPW